MHSSGMFSVFVSIIVMAHQPSSAQTTTAPPERSAHVNSRLFSDREPSPDFPPLPKGVVGLVGGTVAKVDRIHDRVVVRAFGGRDVKIEFDGRTKIIRAETKVAAREIQTGARIYADTILVNGRIFAKTIRIETSPAVGEVRGQVTGFDPATSVLTVRDALSSEPIEVRISPETAIRAGDQPAQPSQLTVGTLVKVGFRSGPERPDTAWKIDILAQPGTTFTFAGRITFVDLRAGYVAIADQADANTYDVTVASLPPGVKLLLKEGADVIVHAQFDGRKYQAQTIELKPSQPR